MEDEMYVVKGTRVPDTKRKPGKNPCGRCGRPLAYRNGLGTGICKDCREDKWYMAKVVGK